MIIRKIEKVVFCCDSTIVLHWIHQTNSHYKAFVGNRGSEIHPIKSDLEATLEVGMVSWRYVPSEYNLADDITRRLRPAELNMGHRYNDGPKFLYEPAELWPENKVDAPLEEDDESEKKKERRVGASQEIDVILRWKKYSSLGKPRRVTAYVMRSTHNTRVRSTYVDRAQSCSEISGEESTS